MRQSWQGCSLVALQYLALFPQGTKSFVTQHRTPLPGSAAQDPMVCGISRTRPVPLRQNDRCNNSNSKLFGIHEWRDTNFDHLPQADDYFVVADDDEEEEEVEDEVYVSYLSVGSGTVAELGEEEKLLLDALSDEEDEEESEEVMLLREVCVLPFPYEDALVQGETKQLRLYEERFIKLFEKANREHSGVVAMGLLAENGLIQTVPLCEIEDFNSQMKDSLGIFVTVRVVGRATLVELSQQEPYIVAVCTELFDEQQGSSSLSSTPKSSKPSKLSIPLLSRKPQEELQDLVAGNIENIMVTLSSLQHRITQQHTHNRAVEDARQALEDSQQPDKGKSEEDNKKDEEMLQRLEKARRRDEFLLSDEDDSGEDDEDGSDFSNDISGIFQSAFKKALQTDVQGYTTSKVDDASTTGRRSIQHLTALSWAAFCIPQMDVTYKLQAMDGTNLFDRLKLAMYVLREIKSEMEAKVALISSADAPIVKDESSNLNAKFLSDAAAAAAQRKPSKSSQTTTKMFDIDDEDDPDSDLWDALK